MRSVVANIEGMDSISLRGGQYPHAGPGYTHRVDLHVLRSRIAARSRFITPGYCLPGYQGCVVSRSKPGMASRWSSIRVRIAASGSGPRQAAMLSERWSGFEVAGRATVTAGCEITHFRKYCDHVEIPTSAAKSGSGRSPTNLVQPPLLQRHVHRDRDAVVGSQRQDALLGATFGDRVASLHEVEVTGLDPRSHRPEVGWVVVSNAQSADAPLSLPGV